MSTIVAELELDLEVFTGPFDLLLTLVLKEEVDLLEVELADVVLSYIDVLEARGELDLEVATEFLVLIAARTSASVPAVIARAFSAPCAKICSIASSSARSAV